MRGDDPHRHFRLALRAVARRVLSEGSARSSDELEFASRKLSTIEINGSFYSLQRPEYYARWHDETPPGFVFSVKGGALHHAHDAAARRSRRRSRTSSRRALPSCATSSARSSGSSRRASRSTASASRPSSSCCRATPRQRSRAPRAPKPRQARAHAMRSLSPAPQLRDAARSSTLLREHDVALVVADTAGNGRRRRRDVGFRLRPPARRQEALRERLHDRRARALGRSASARGAKAREADGARSQRPTHAPRTRRATSTSTSTTTSR